MREQLIRGVIGSFGLKVGRAGLSLAISVLLARALAPEGYGLYAFALSVMSLLGIPIQCGLQPLIVREVAKYHQKQRWSQLRGILRQTNLTVGILSLAIGLPAAAVIWWIANSSASTEYYTFWWALLLLPLIAMNRLRASALQGLRQVVRAQLPEQFLMPITFLILIVASRPLVDLSPSLAMALHCAAVATAFVAGALLLLRALPAEVRTTKAAYDTQNLMRSLLPLALLNGIHVLQGQTDVFLLGALAPKAELGLYRVAISGAALVVFTQSAVASVLSPHVARLHSAGDHTQLQKLATHSARLTLVSAFPVAAILVVFGVELIEIVYGQVYTQAYIAMCILCGAQLVNVSTGFANTILIMAGKETIVLRGIAISALSNVILNLALIPSFGLEGAAVATAFSIILFNVILLHRLWREMEIWSFPIPLPKRLED